ncbi:MAG TPA: twin-arginine translocase TatA/TatE family subunit [Gemmataceae bacterium]|nr:twin-arginine translocase TatA/TatE family subunit [Gemmataceae bacterium]
MFGLGTAEIVLLLAIGLVLFGSKLPELARSLGKTMTEVRKGFTDIEEDLTGAARR